MLNPIKKYLQLNHFSNLTAEFEKAFFSHPNYPSIFAITDSLTLLGVENIAIKVPKEQFVELPVDFLAMYNNQIVLVSKSASSVKIEDEENKKQSLSFDNFLSGWNQIVIAIEPNSESHSSVKKSFRLKEIGYVVPLALTIALSLYCNNFSLYSAFNLLMSIFGLIISVLIIKEKMGIKSDLASKVCGITNKNSCDSVIQSDSGQINAWLSFSDLPLVFFSTNFLFVLSGFAYSNTVISYVSLLGIPVLLYSVWLQQYQLKSWCVLCVIVSILTLVQSLGVLGVPGSLSLSNGITYFFVGLIVVTSWVLIRPFIESKFNNDQKINELKRFKRNFKAFKALTATIPKGEGFEKLEGIKFGNKHVPLQLSLFLSPSCGHCHTAFEEAYNLYVKFPEKVVVEIFFNINPENHDNPYKSIVATLLALHKSNPDRAKEAIIDWHIHKLDKNKWEQKYTDQMDLTNLDHEIAMQYEWCFENNFNYTPVKIVNKLLFPNEYTIEELKYFHNDFEEEFLKNQENNSVLIENI